MSTHTEDTKEMTVEEQIINNVVERYLEMLVIKQTKNPVSHFWLKTALKNTLTLYASQVRGKWLREEIVKLEGMEHHEPNRGIYRSDVIQTIIDRYQAELTTLTPNT